MIPYLQASKELDAPFDRNGQTGFEYRPAYSPEDCEGLPCAVQLIGRPMHDEELMQHLDLVENVLKAQA